MSLKDTMLVWECSLNRWLKFHRWYLQLAAITFSFIAAVVALVCVLCYLTPPVWPGE